MAKNSFRKKAKVDVQLGSKYSSGFLFYFKGTLSNAALKISLYISAHIKIITWKFLIYNPKNCGVIRCKICEFLKK